MNNEENKEEVKGIKQKPVFVCPIDPAELSQCDSCQ